MSDKAKQHQPGNALQNQQQNNKLPQNKLPQNVHPQCNDPHGDRTQGADWQTKHPQREHAPVFPLSLSSLQKPAPGRSVAADRVATPQTATRNAAQHGGQSVQGNPNQYPNQYPNSARPGSHKASAVFAAAPSRGDGAGPMGPGASGAALVSDTVRRAMVARLAQRGVNDQLVLDAMLAVPRHAFVEGALATQAYIDTALPIGHHQTISQPYIVARMIEVMRAGQRLQNVLEIGTGCGYQAAVLARVAREVVSIERIKALHALAKSNLRQLRVPNLRLHYGDGMLGLPQMAPFDGIILAAAGLEVPQALLDQLAIGGRLVAPVGAKAQHLQLITRAGTAQWISETLESCHFVPLCSGTA